MINTLSIDFSFKMFVSSFLILLLTITSAYGLEECASKKSNAQHRLKEDLLCGYERTIRPVTDHKSSIRVLIRLILKYFSYDEHDNTFSIDSWMAVYWKDQFLTWNPNDYDSVESIHLASDEIWMPDIAVYNRNDQSGDPSAIESATCIVQSNGQVVCVPPAHHTSLCVGDLTRYPYDKQNCTVRFGSWVHSGEEIDIRVANPPLTQDDLVPNGQWTLKKTTVVKHPGNFKCCPNNTYPSINYSFEIERMYDAHAASIILPAIALIVITLTSLWVSPDNPHRLTLCSVNLVCEFLFSQNLSWMLPLRGRDTPLILLFARDSLLLCAFTIVFSVILKNMLNTTKPAPFWISAFVGIVTGCRCGQWAFMNESSIKDVAALRGEADGATIIEPDSKQDNTQDWYIFARVLDRICFVSYCIVYICMFIAFMP